MIPLEHYIYIGAILFSIGLFIVLTKKHTIFILMGIELIFNAANINLVAFGSYNVGMHGQMFTLFVIFIAACEAAVALAIVLNTFKYFRSINPESINDLKE